jgi:mannosyl-oligosaccharide alpha-1,2-mannosidase
VTPQRHLLYATTTYGIPPKPTYLFEHLSCFLPGLLALGAHTLPLDNLPSLGIDLIKLSEGVNEDSAKGYKILAQYDLRQLHMWAAEGLTETCYLTYADQVSGMGPDELWMAADAEGGTWIEAVERWKQSGARGSPPGLAPKAPVKFDATAHTLTGGNSVFDTQRTIQDYSFKRRDYLLRPEVFTAGHFSYCLLIVVDADGRVSTFDVADNGGQSMAGARVGDLPSS